MTKLKDELEGVNPESLPDKEAVTPEGDPKAESAEGKNSEDRFNQLHREFDRKFSKLERKFSEFMDSAKEKPQPSGGTGDVLDKYSLADLRGMRAQITDQGQLATLDSYISARAIREEVDTRLDKFTAQQTFKQRRDEANSIAASRYPDLLDEDSDFYAEVQSRMSREGNEYRTTNPRAILDIANDVAAELGMPARTVRGRKAPKTVVTKADSADPEAPVEKSVYSDEKNNEIAKRLRRALPPGSKGFNMDEIKKQQNEYSKHKDLIIRG